VTLLVSCADGVADRLLVPLRLRELLPERLPLADGLCELLPLPDALSLLLGLPVRLPDGELLRVAPELPETVDEAVVDGELLSELVAEELAVCREAPEKNRRTAAHLSSGQAESPQKNVTVPLLNRRLRHPPPAWV
jgi:hypothetical protein